MPNFDDDSLTLKRKTRELQQSQNNLNSRRREYQLELTTLLQRDEFVESQKHELTGAKERFSKFVSENSAKKETALKKMEEEYGDEEKLRVVEARCKQVHFGMQWRLKLLKQKVQSMMLFEHFLKELCKHQESFESPEKI